MGKQHTKSPRLEDVDFPVVIIDGVCNLCNASVDFIIRRDRGRRFRFAANEQDNVQQLLRLHSAPPTNGAEETIYLYQDGKLYDRSTAVLRIAKQLPWPWPALFVLVVVPTKIRNVVYRFVAANRYRWFGRSEVCRLPNHDDLSRFL